MHQADTGSPTREVQSRRPTPKDFRPDIEGLRGFTLLAILGFHAEVPGVGGGFVGPLMIGYTLEGIPDPENKIARDELWARIVTDRPYVYHR